MVELLLLEKESKIMGKCGCRCNCENEKVRDTRDNRFTKDTTIGEVLQTKPELKNVLEGFGLHCFGCPMSQMETLEEACQVHDIELDFMLKKLNDENA